MDDVWKRLRALGDDFTPAQLTATRELFVPRALQPAQVKATVTRDLAYGPHARHRLDVFAPAGAGARRPVVVYVHGGGFVQGDKGGEGAPFFNNVGAWAVRSGFIGITLSYRLAPEHPWPAGAADVDLAMHWLKTHIAPHGGDPSRIVLMGHSAGAAHVAGYFARHGCVPDSKPEAAGAVFISGIYAPELYPHDHEYRAYYGSDRSQDSARSTVAALAGLHTPNVFTISEFDPAPLHQQLAVVFAARVQSQQRCPEVVFQRNHNHVSVVMQVGSDLDTLGGALAEFIRQR
jgi:triacylglycerol lipase